MEEDLDCIYDRLISYGGTYFFCFCEYLAEYHDLD